MRANAGPGTELRRRREAAASHLHREGVPRLLDVRHPRPRAARARRRAEARPAPHHLRDERARARLRQQAQEVRAHGRRRHRQVPSARRQRVLRSHGADGAAVRVSLSDRGRAGQLGLAGRSEVLRGHALHRGEAHEVRRGAAVRAGARHRRLDAELRRHDGRAVVPAGAPAEPAAEWHVGHRGRHGDGHSAAQPARSRRTPAFICSRTRKPPRAR